MAKRQTNEKRLKNANIKDTDIIDRALAIEEKESLEKDDIIAKVEEAYFTDDYDYSRTLNEIRFYQEQAGYSLIEMGKRLLRIKAHEEHGMFMLALEKLNIARRTANYSMVAARKFANVHAHAHLGNDKIRALTVLDDNEIKELYDKGEIFGMTLDDIDRMTTRELRANLRNQKDKIESLEKIIKHKEEKNNELERAVRGLEAISKEKIAQEKCEEYIKEFSKKIASIQMDFLSLKQMMDEIQSIDGINLVIIEEFQEKLNLSFGFLEGSRTAFYDVYDNAHVYSREEQLNAGVVKSYGDNLKDEKRRY